MHPADRSSAWRRGLDDLGSNPFDGLPADVSVRPEFADITDQLERKIMGINL